MNAVSREMRTIISDVENSLSHEGTPRHSGRYPWGSGKNPAQHGSGDFLSRVEALKKQGWKATTENIAATFGMKSQQYRDEVGKCQTERRMNNIRAAQSISGDLGLNPLTGKPKYSAIGAKLGVSESTVRGWMEPKAETKTNQAREIADFIKENIDKRGMIDVGPGVEAELGISYTKLNRALSLLQDEGYPMYSGGVRQPTNPGQQTTQRVIGPPGTQHKDIYKLQEVHSLSQYTSHDDGKTFDKFVYPKSLDSKRMKIRYAEDKGKDGIPGLDKDGIIELRRGVPDISLGAARYSQVRILVDGTHYMKGMAVYSDTMPDGVDVVFNTNKPKGTGMAKTLKEIKSDPDNPFGSTIKAGGQSYYTDKKGNKQLSVINKRADEGDWTEWKDALPSQFLSKQSYALAKKQLKMATDNKIDEYNSIMALTNPTIKKHLLYKFADECDSAAVHLQAAALPGQKYHVIIPINTLKEHEVYAPGYPDGTKLALVRYPHGGTFEIPILTVNNKNELGRKVIGPSSVDAIGITKKVADRLSGADFDGDTAMAIPTHDPYGKVKITSTRELPGLKGFDAKYEYGTKKGDDGEYYSEKHGHKIILMKNDRTGSDSTQKEMGMISNLITDMTLAGAYPHELAKAVRHSQVVIDAGKHKLDYKQSELDNDIKSLKKKYQQSVNPDGSIKMGSGASTIISKASGPATVTKRQGTPKINKKGTAWYDPTIPEGSYIYKDTDKPTYEKIVINKRTGDEVVKTIPRTQRSTKMAEVEDAYALVSAARHPMELVYADYANTMKDMARKSRLDYTEIEKIAYNKDSARVYAKEVVSLKEKVTTSSLNKPKEREALRRANVEIEGKKAIVKAETGNKIKNGDLKKISQAAITKYRGEVDSITRKKRNIAITDKEWLAIQSGAISESILTKILDNTDIAELRQRAMPKSSSSLSTGQIARVKSLSNQGYNLSEIAAKMSTSSTTISQYLKGVKV